MGAPFTYGHQELQLDPCTRLTVIAERWHPTRTNGRSLLPAPSPTIPIPIADPDPVFPLPGALVQPSNR